MKQNTIILKESQKSFLVKRVITYGTGFEPGVELIGTRYEIWDKKYQDKYEQDIIQEPVNGSTVVYCELCVQESDEKMIEVFDKRENGIYSNSQNYE
ncbi:hypothetical protein P22_3029 [Propionispora sp. 2/2-37]|uniref:hypothetical protein n=1 Tax=Propionispora sp. 2/2-37 TaxID=1677858 RepID=UPI0006BB8562|nr:hypothetical protein [Propionispora sp. 2/2-37]CUH96917.1 hypothetical protein P22_3029 [Propionispora sp. 2/2-37]